MATRNYIGILSTVNCSATVAHGIADAFKGEALARVSQRRRRGRADARQRLRHGRAGREHAGAAAHARRLRAARQLRRRADRRPRLRGEPDQRAAGRGAARRRRAAAHLQHPGYGRHGQVDRRGRRDGQGDAAARESGAPRGGAGEPSRPGLAMRRLGWLLGHYRQSRRWARRSTCWCVMAAPPSCRKPRRSTAPSICSRVARCRAKSAKSSSPASSGGRNTPRATKAK